jgi:CheY-like chemotaxis protein
MPGGGRLLLDAENVALEDDYARYHLEARPGDFVRLRVSDTGSGMTPEVKARIFEPFFTTKEVGKGTGLGLAMVFGIVKQHQGWIDCYSEPGQGACFHIYLPRSGSLYATASPSAAPTPCQGHETILLADDEALVRNLGRTILQRYGYRVLLAKDGEEAVEVYRRERDQIDLVVLDLTMPRLSGRDACRRLREAYPEVRVLYASGYSADHALRGSHDGALGFVGKPYRPEELARSVRAALDRPAAGRADGNGAGSPVLVPDAAPTL